MWIEAGARSGLFAPDETTYAYLKGRPMAPAGEDWERKLAWWRTLPTDRGARFDRTVRLDAAQIAPNVTWGTSPEDVAPITAPIPDPESFADPARQPAARQSPAYTGLAAGTAPRDVPDGSAGRRAGKEGVGTVRSRLC